MTSSPTSPGIDALQLRLDLLRDRRVSERDIDEVEYRAKRYVSQGFDVEQALARAEWGSVVKRSTFFSTLLAIQSHAPQGHRPSERLLGPETAASRARSMAGLALGSREAASGSGDSLGEASAH